eukprot:183267_1
MKRIATVIIWTLAMLLTDGAVRSYPNNYNSWIVGHSSLPRPARGMAVGYDNISDSFWLLGGDEPENQAQLVQYKPTSDEFIDNGSHALLQTIGWVRCYSQFQQHLYIIQSSTVHRFNVYNQIMDYDHYTIPIYVNSGCICILDRDDGYIVINYKDNVEILNISDSTWISGVPSLNLGRTGTLCNTYKNKIFMIGGYACEDDYCRGFYTDSVEVMLFGDNHWQWNYINDTLSMLHYMKQSVVFNDEIVIFGGKLPPRYGTEIASTAAINVANTIYLFGGWNNNGGDYYPSLSSWRYVKPNTFMPTSEPTNAPTNAPTSSNAHPEIQKVRFEISKLLQTTLINYNVDYIILLIQRSFVYVTNNILNGNILEYKDFHIRQTDYKNNNKNNNEITIIIEAELLYNESSVLTLIVGTANSDKFKDYARIETRTYFNDTNAELAILLIEDVHVDDSSSFDYLLYSLLSFIFLMGFISLIAFIYNKKDGTKVDDAASLAVFIFGLQIFDFISDIILSTEMFVILYNDNDSNKSN